MRMIHGQRAPLALAVLLVPAACFGWDISLHPREVRGGEAFLARVTGVPRERQCTAVRGGKEYPLHDRGDGVQEAFLPVGIEERGRAKVVVRCAGADGDVRRSALLTVTRRRVKIVKLREQDETMRDASPMVDQQQAAVLGALATRSDRRLWRESFVSPVEHASSTPFALKRVGKKYTYYHKGLDFDAPEGAPVRAMNDGVVVMSSATLNVYGGTLIIDHGQGVVSCYFHLRSLAKRAGENVRRGEEIGAVGSTGWASGPHLHMGVYVQGSAVDPAHWMRLSRTVAWRGAREYAGLDFDIMVRP